MEKIFKRICLIVFTCFILLASCTTQRVTVDTDGLEHQRRIVELENRVRDYEDRIRQYDNLIGGTVERLEAVFR